MKKILWILTFLPLFLSAQPCKEVIGYYPNWQWYDRAKLVNPMTIDYSKYSIINYAFFKPETNGTIVSTDTWADENLLQGPINWSTTPVSHNASQSIVGKAHANGVKILISVGGWTLSDNFPSIAASPTKRATFASSCKSLIQTYDLDGIDIDWEYPGYTPNSGTTADKQNYTLFLQQVRDTLNAYQNVTGKTYMMTACFGASQSNMANIEWNNVKNILDIMNIMTYDFFGSWDATTNHNSPLYAPVQGDPTFNLSAAVSYIITNYGVPANKIAAGVAFYGRSFKTTGTPGLHVASTGTADNITFQLDDGTPSYYNILANLSLFTKNWDNSAKVPYLTGNNSLKTFVSYDDKQSIGLKASYIKNNNLRGAIIWEITGDYLETSVGSGVIAGTPLADTLNLVFCGSTTPPVNIAPSVSLTSPSNNSSFTAPASITLQATASDSDGTINKVEFYNGTTLLGQDLTSPYSFAWANVAAGTYTITAKATDNSNAVTNSTAITVVVNASNVNIPPTVSLTAPNTNSVFPSGSTVVLQANAADANGTVTKVQFYRGTTLIGTDLTAPYSLNWANVAVGSYVITAKATDNSNAVTTSSSINVTVNANIAPTVALTSPLTNTQFTAPTPITLQASASDTDGTISKVQFYNGTILLSTDATSPYSYAWTNVAAGTYTITAKATDNSNAVTISTAITLIVNPTSSNTPPTVSLTSPTNASNFTSLANINLTANASDLNGLVSKVEFYKGTSLIGSDLTAPYSFSWLNVPAGTYVITAKATDNNGASTTSTASTITVTMPANNVLPTVSFISPLNNAIISPAPATIVISANAADANGSINKVFFYNGTALLSQITTAPYTYSWTNVAAGTYTLKARAMDNNGALSSLATITITVNAASTNSCTSPQYVAGTSYTQNALVQNGGNQYTCNVPGWCGASPLYYEPGLGSNWQQAWALIGPCTQTSGGNVLPTIALTAPTNNAAYINPSSLTLSANASDSDGSISNVAFYNGSTLLGNDATSPYSLTLTNPSAAVYTITAKATDNLGGNSTSLPITVVIGNNTTPCTRPAWVASTAYVANDTISYAGVAYKAKWWTQNENPATSGVNGAWATLGNCGSSANIRYANPLVNIPTEIFPNPTNGKLAIKVGEITSNQMEILLYNTIGQQVISLYKLVDNHTLDTEIDLSDLANGVYTLILETEDMRIVKKVVKE